MSMTTDDEPVTATTTDEDASVAPPSGEIVAPAGEAVADPIVPDPEPATESVQAVADEAASADVPDEPEPEVPASAEVDEPEPESESESESVSEAEAAEPEVPAEPPSSKRWYVIKVASNREDSTKRNIERQMRIEGLEHLFGQIVIPFEEVVEVKKVSDTTKSGDKVTKTKKVVKKVKKYPGYVMAEVEWNPEVQAMLRGVSGVSDFVGAQGIGKPPPPMSDIDVQRMLGTYKGGGGGAGNQNEEKKKEVVVKLHFEKGDKVRIRDGAFANFEGIVKGISESKESGETPVVTVGVQVLGRETSIEMEFWQVDKL